MTHREILLKKIGTYKFALTDLHLFLDTHPTDESTIAKIREYEKMLRPLVEEFESKYGPLRSNTDIQKSFLWIKDPWPWDTEDTTDVCI